MKKLLVLSFAIAVLAAGPAIAADLPVKTQVYKAPAVVTVPVLTWTSCYVGGNVGYGWAHKNFYDPQAAGDSGSNTSTGAAGGGQIGCDYQTGQFVFGVHGMFDWASLDGSHPWAFDTSQIDHSKVSWFSTLTGRIGYAVQPASLIYLKGGAAWVRDTFTETGPQADKPGVAKVTRSGWTIGAGLEYIFVRNWSLFVEYNYMDFGRKTATLHYVDDTTYNYAIKQNVQAALIGVNYRFGSSR